MAVAATACLQTNHVDLCPNDHHTKACDFDLKQPCLYWVAGKNYSKGQEVGRTSMA